jgi:hypothetical protein
MHKLIGSVVFLLLFHCYSFCQSCFQPGALVSIINRHIGNYDYIIFKFIKPHLGKGVLTPGEPSLLFTTKAGKKYSYYKITFNDVAHFCEDKMNVQVPGKKLMGFKIQQQQKHIITYAMQLAEGAKISAHYASLQQNFYYVKIRIE